MKHFDVEHSYNREKNISIIRFIGTPKSEKDIDDAINKLKNAPLTDGIHKAWNIGDMRKFKLASSRLIAYYQKQTKPFLLKYVIRYVAVADSVFQRLTTKMFNSLRGDKSPIVSSMKEAMVIIAKWQDEEGIFPSS